MLFRSKNSSLHIDLIDDGTEVIKVYEMKNLGNQILAYLKPNYKQCVNCGKMIKIKGKNSQYCDECAEKIMRENWKLSKQRLRNG